MLILKRFFLVILSVTVFIILIDLFLHLIGVLYNYNNTKLSTSSDDTSYRILCIGGSHTEGIGAPSNLSYPNQLQEMLRNFYHTNKIKVINKGFHSLNSFQIKSSLEQNLNDFKPNLVILEAGEPNFWNFTGQEYFFENSFLRLVHKFKIFKFFSYLNHILKKKIPRKSFIERLEIQKVESSPPSPTYFNIEDFQKSLSKDKWLEAFSKDSASDNEVMLALRYLIYKSQNDSTLLPLVAQIYEYHFHDFQEAIKWYMLAILQLNDPPNYDLFWNCAYNLNKLRSISTNNKFNQLFKDFFAEIQALRPEFMIHFYGLQTPPSRSNIEKWIKQDIETMVTIIKKNNINLIIQNYAPQPPQYPQNYLLVNSILKTVATEQSVPFIDQYSLIIEIFENTKTNKNDYYFQSFGIPDTHFNEKGYTLVANNIFSFIISNKYIQEIDKN